MVNEKIEIEFLDKVEKDGFKNQFRLSHIPTSKGTIDLPPHYNESKTKYKIVYNGSNRYKGIFEKLIREDIVEILFKNVKICLSLTEKGVSYKRDLRLKLLLTN